MNGNKCESPLVKMLVKNKNTIFLLMCLVIHFSYLVIFLLIGAIPLSVINGLSVVFYVLFLLFSKDKEASEKASVTAFFEILIFSMLCETFTRNTYGYIYYTIGMVTAVFFLTPSYGNKRFAFQGIGFMCAVLIHHYSFIIPDSYFPETYELLKPFAQTFNFINLFITVGTMMYVAFFYKLELDILKSDMNYASTHDPLTGLYNRRFLYSAVKEGKEDSIAIALLDIDNFKRINDEFGHDVGDDMLVAVSRCLMEEAGKVEIYPVRWGGEEFIIYFKNNKDEDVYELVRSLCSRITVKAVLPDSSGVTVTTGLASGKREDFDVIVKRADDLLYKGKHGGKNCIVWSQNEDRYSA